MLPHRSFGLPTGPKDTSSAVKQRSNSSRIPAKSSSHVADKKETSTPSENPYPSKSPEKKTAKLQRKRQEPEHRKPQIPGPPQTRRKETDTSLLHTDAYGRPSPTSPYSVDTAQYSTPTPSLGSGSSASTRDSPLSNSLRRKPPIIGKYMSQKHSKSNLRPEKVAPTSEPHHIPQNEIEESGFAMALTTDYDTVVEAHRFQERTIDENTRPSQERQRLNEGAFLPSTTPVSNQSVTPSLHQADSMGAFSHTTTPTSHTCYSPVVSTSPHFGPHAWTSPTKSPLGLPPNAMDSEERRSMDTPSEPSNSVNLAGAKSKTGRIPLGKKVGPTTTAPSRDVANAQSRETSTLARSRPLIDATESEEIPIGPPPELAHLMVDNNVNQTIESRPPSRPSRAGTTKLHVSRDPSPVVISNLPRAYTLQQKRRSASSVADSATSSASGSTGVLSSQPSRKPTTKSQTSGEAFPNLNNSIKNPEIAGQETDDEGISRKNPSPVIPSTSPAKAGSKFGFFSRKPKADAIESTEDVSKPSKKGPMAGTGHEGYGKPTGRRRSGSSASTGGNPTRSISAGPVAANRKSNSSSKDGDLDDFLLQRISPVYIRGEGSASDNQIPSRQEFRSGGSQDTTGSEPTNASMLNSPQTSNTSQSSFGFSRPGRAIPRSTNTSMSSKASQPVHSTSSKLVGRETSQSPSKHFARPQIPRPGKPDQSPSIGTASDTSQNFSSFEEQRGHVSDTGAKGKKSNWGFFSRQSKSAQKWNPFHRAQTAPPAENVPLQHPIRTSEENKVHAAAYVPAADMMRSVAHYALIDSENEEQIAFEDLETMMEEAAAAEDDNDSAAGDHPHTLDEHHAKGAFREEHFPIFAPSLYESPEVSQISFAFPADESASYITNEKPWHKTAAQDRQEDTKPRRLQQVGRIPPVASKKDRDRMLPSESFSRPFARNPRPSISSPDVSSLNSTFTPPSISKEFSERDSWTNDSTEAAFRNSSAGQQEIDRSKTFYDASNDAFPSDFLSFPTRNDSDLSYSSSSGTFYFPTSQATAVIPSVGSPPSEDEVWQEYDDLIDQVLTPTISNTSQTGPALTHKTSHLVDKDNELTPKNVKFKGKDSPLQARGLGSDVRPAVFQPTPSSSANLLSPAAQELAMHSPSSVYSDPKGESGNQKSNLGTSSALTAGSSVQRPVMSTQPLHEKEPSSVPEIAAQIKLDRDSLQSQQSPELSQSQELRASTGLSKANNMANLRFGALMTSKWLSFGRVLFSPAHFELNGSSEDRILVVDGLGKDWSYYCALSYPNATIYNLGPEAATSSQRNSLGTWQSLPNHRHFTHPDINANFPFPKSFFSVVVFRFPAASSEAGLKGVIGECKRVLRPGGYIEVSSLDLDLTNMGNHARRAIRALKMKMQRAIPDVTLKPASDNIQRLLGRRGFENLNRCLVGVPVAGIVGSPTRSVDETDPSFTELIKDQSAAGDAGITKMVGRVGRWWYTRCFETAVLPPSSGGAGPDLSESIWADRALLKECEKLQTTFRLLVCYAQKPTVAKRRAVSL